MSRLPALTDGNNNNNSSGNDKSAGYLEICILSAYDLPAREPPQGVQITVDKGGSNYKALSGPPIQRHKDRNSFKFGSNNNPNGGNNNSSNNSNITEIVAPLSTLYNGKATFQVMYEAETGNEPMQATYELSQLHVHETQWLVLNLEPASSMNSSDGTTAESEEDTFRVPPTLRLKLTLHGPYRTEIAAAMQVAQAWFGMVDKLEASGAVVVKHLPDPKWFLIPAVPAVAIVVVSLPVVAGVLVVALPMVLPALVVLAVASTACAASILFLYASTAQGRQEWLQPLLGPAAATILSTPTGQQVVYQTGPRPTPVKLCRIVLPQESLWGKLIVSLWIDLVGSSSYLLPVVGEGFDIVWAPVQTILIMALYDEVTPNLKYVSFIEEILPFTDIVPSASIGWLAEFGVPWAEQQLGLKGVLDDPSTNSVTNSTQRRLMVSGTPSTPFSTPRR